MATINTKLCKDCGFIKEFIHFYKSKAGKYGLDFYCKECSKQRKQTPKAKKLHNISNVKYLHSEKGKQTRAAGKKVREQYNNEYNKKRKKEDINFKLRSTLRIRLACAISKESKRGSAVRDLGCTIPELKQYIEARFQPGMTWENHGRTGWHIDHIKPLSSFDLTDRDQLLQAVHYTNLQPLWAKDNLTKNDKVS